VKRRFVRIGRYTGRSAARVQQRQRLRHRVQSRAPPARLAERPEQALEVAIRLTWYPKLDASPQLELS
jgi:hypothetical protein